MGQDSETTQVETISERKALDLRLCSVKNDNIKARLDAGDQALSENCEEAEKEDLRNAGKPVVQLVTADVAGDGSLAPTAYQEIEHISGSQAAAGQGKEAQSEDYPLEKTSEPEAVPETQCEEQEEELQVKEKQINEDESLSQRFILEREVQCHEDMEVEFADGSCKNRKKLSDQAQELEKIGPESQGKETSKCCTFGTGEAKSMDKLSFKAASENMPKLNEVLSKPSVGELLEQHNNLFPKLKGDVPSEVACTKKHPGCPELGQIIGNQPPLQERGADVLVTQQENPVPENTEDAVRTRNLEQAEQPHEKATANSPSPSSGKWI